jgi:gliding motility-associated protein GldM
MGGGKETPRQKMIGMMYLVLTALLAMNVSKQVLKGYMSVNESLVKTVINLDENNKRVIKAFEESISGNAAAKPYFEKAVECMKEIGEMEKYVAELRSKIIAETEPLCLKNEKIADTLNMRSWEAPDNFDMPSHHLGIAEPKHPTKGPWTADELKTKLNALHAKLVSIVAEMQKNPTSKFLDEDFAGINKKFDLIKPVDSKRIEGGTEFNWEMDNFYHLPLAAVVANFNKMRSDLKNVEAEVLLTFSAASGKLAIKFDAIKARVVAPSSYIQAGQPYEADIFIAASSSKLSAGDMEIIIGVDSAGAAAGAKGTLVPIVGGEGKYSVGTGGEGDQTYRGVIKYKDPTGSFKYYPFEQSYKVAKAAASVSADMMNVFYAGVPNPVTAAAAGISPADISVNPTGCGVRATPKGAGKYEFTFTSVGECMITVNAKTKEGVKAQGLPVKFRVKPLPKPDVKIGGKYAPPELKKSDLFNVGALGAGAQGFDFQANFVVVSWSILGKVRGKIVPIDGTGPNLSAEAIATMKGLEVGSKLYIDAKIKGPDGKFNSTTVGIKVTK